MSGDELIKHVGKYRHDEFGELSFACNQCGVVESDIWKAAGVTFCSEDCARKYVGEIESHYE